MKSLIKVILVVGVCFASTFVVLRLTGAVDGDRVARWVEMASEASILATGAVVFALLFADLFVAVPTLTVTVLSGYFLGHLPGALFAAGGLYAAGICGYWVSRRFGDRILRKLLRTPAERDEAVASFERNGFLMIVLSRAVPILPEVTACLAGITGMAFFRFLVAWTLSVVPYVTLAAYAGSISSIDNPRPAIVGALAISGTLWVAWFGFRKAFRR
jgi:uncharacterized membrane protein YdjX (TVP38/TMEM64 family)